MKKMLPFLLMIMLLPIAFASSYYTAETLDLKLKVGSEAVIKPQSSNYNVQQVLVNVTFAPSDTINQKVLSFDAGNFGKLESDSVVFTFDNPSSDVLEYAYTADIRTFNRVLGVRNKIKFPLEGLPEGLESYIEPAEIIDSNDPAIIEAASKVAEGDDDLYSIVHKVAAWTKSNVEYNLSTLTAEASQKASWVLENRQGVCDEITSLFIAMLRSLGIPARFVSVVSYTESPLFAERWGAHGWAEVYFPDVGWVPFDVTYGEFGYIDPTHITLGESPDSNKIGTQFKWTGRNANLETKSLEMGADIIRSGKKSDGRVSIEVKPLKQEVSFDSYNAIEVKVKNPGDFYVSTEAQISKTDELESLEGHTKSVMLMPYQEKSVFFIVKVSDSLRKNFIYTFPVIARDELNTSAESSFKSSENSPYYSLSEIEEIVGQRAEEEEMIYSRNVEIQCSIDKKEFYQYDSAKIKCNVKNNGNVFLENLDVCYKKCSRIDLGISQEKEVVFDADEKAGQQDVLIRARNDYVSKTENVEFTVFDVPVINVKDVKVPSSVEYGDKFDAEFIMDKASFSNPMNVKVKLLRNGHEKGWAINELPEDKAFAVNLEGRRLKEGRNDFEILLEYEDENGRKYTSSGAFSVSLVNLNALQKIAVVFFQLNESLANITPETAAIIAVMGSAVFILIVVFVFRKRN